MQQGNPEEREHCWLWPCSIAISLCSNIKASTFECHWSKSRTTCSQEGENDEDITCSDTTTLATFDSQVKQSFTMIVFDTFDELMLHHDVCSLSFLEIHTWIKKSVKDTWKAWRTKEVDWGPSTSIPNVLHQNTTSLLAQGKIKSNTFWGWIQTPGHLQLVMFTTVAYGLRLGC